MRPIRERLIKIFLTCLKLNLGHSNDVISGLFNLNLPTKVSSVTVGCSRTANVYLGALSGHSCWYFNVANLASSVFRTIQNIRLKASRTS